MSTVTWSGSTPLVGFGVTLNTNRNGCCGGWVVLDVVVLVLVVEVVPWTGWVVEVVVVEPFPPEAAAIPTPAPATPTAPRATGAAPIPPAANPAGRAGKTLTEAFVRYAAIGLSWHS